MIIIMYIGDPGEAHNNNVADDGGEVYKILRPSTPKNNIYLRNVGARGRDDRTDNTNTILLYT